MTDEQKPEPDNTVECETIEEAASKVITALVAQLESQEKASEQSGRPLLYHRVEHSLHAAFFLNQHFPEIANAVKKDKELLEKNNELSLEDPAKLDNELEQFLDTGQTTLVIYAIGHDVIQEGSISPEGTLKRRRGAFPQDIADLGYSGVVGNEEASAQAIYTELCKYQYPNGNLIFTLSHETIINDIAGTYPERITLSQLQQKLGTNLQLPEPTGHETEIIYQPYLNATYLAGFLLATYDLRGSVGIKNTDDYLSESDREFWEVNIGLQTEYLDGFANVSLERKNQIIAKLTKWFEGVVTFAQSQKALFEVSLTQHPIVNHLPNLQAYLKSIFTKFDENATAAKTRAEKAQTITNQNLPADKMLQNLVELLMYKPEKQQ